MTAESFISGLVGDKTWILYSKRPKNKWIEMELALVISIASLCGFAAALSYNVYEFKKVGKALDEGRKEHRRMIRALDGINESLGRVNESLAALAKSLGSKGRTAK